MHYRVFASLLGLLTFFVLGPISCDSHTHGTQNLKTYVVNLDDEPRKRWNQVLPHFDANLVKEAVYKTFKMMGIGDVLRSLSIKIAGDLDKYIPQPYADEMRGISDFWKVDLGFIVLANIMYDVVANEDVPVGVRACTSIVAMDQDHHILHGRNFDYSFVNIFQKAVAKVDFQRNGTTVFNSVILVSQIGPATGYKPGMFSLSLNQRNEGRWWQNFISGLEGRMPTLLYIREVMEKADSYDSAIQMLKGMKAMSPSYLIVGGIKPYEGTVVIGNRHGVVMETMNNRLQHGWYVVETNYDPWRRPPFDDDRRGAVNKLMKKLGQENTNESTLFQILSTPPILLNETVYTALMRAGDPKIFDVVVVSHSGFDAPCTSITS